MSNGILDFSVEGKVVWATLEVSHELTLNVEKVGPTTYKVEGRIDRTEPHEMDNFVAHVYVPWRVIDEVIEADTVGEALIQLDTLLGKAFYDSTSN